MPMWRCPHCAVPQPEASRCWVCRRSSTSCATCRHFRQAVVAKLGYCGRDRTRAALTGDEIRPCWEGKTGAPDLSGPGVQIESVRPIAPGASLLLFEEP